MKHQAPCYVTRLGPVPYAEAWNLQKRVIDRRLANDIPDQLLLLQHPPTYTYGRGGAGKTNLLVTEERLAALGADLIEADRGGEITFHGPGQIVGYPIIDLNGWRRDAHEYVHALEEVIIATLGEMGVASRRSDVNAGVWVGEKKIASVGVKVSHWITGHGFALNVNTDLTYFANIVPCGVNGCVMTSLAEVTGAPSNEDDVGELLVENFGRVFGRSMTEDSVIALSLTP